VTRFKSGLLVFGALLLSSYAWAQDAGSPDAGADVLPPDAGAADGGTDVRSPATTAGEEPLEPGADRQTGIQGHIYDRKARTPLEQAPVVVTGDGQTRTTLTDQRGAYRLFVPPGTYTVRSYYDLFHGARLDGARVSRGKLLKLDLLLSPIDEQSDVAVQELEIPYRADTTTAVAQDQLRQASSGIGEGFGAKQMSQVGASDAASAAARVVGVSVESDQLVIRGLSGRYNRVLLNGVPVPSMDPDIPGVDVDLFPTNVIERLTISKTFLPDQPADFAGGVMEIRTISFPRKFTLELEVGGGASSESTFRDYLTYRGGKYDRLGFDDGRRSIPSGAAARTRAGFLTEPEAEQFRNSWQYQTKQALPKVGLDLTIGDAIKFGNRKRFGYLVTAGYSFDMVSRRGISRPNNNLDEEGNVLGGQLSNDYRSEGGLEEVTLGTLATASLELNADHALSVLTLFNRKASDQVTRRVGFSVDGPSDKWQLEYLTRSLWFNQVFGDHRNLFGTRLRLRWAGFHAQGERDEPDRRTVAYQKIGAAFEWIDTTASGTRFYSNLAQEDLGANASLRFPLWAEAWGTLGGGVQLSTRDFVNRRFRLRKHPDNLDGSVFQRPAEELFSREGLGRYTEMQDATREDDSYEARQLQYSASAMIETPLVGPLSASGGVRAEIVTQDVDTLNPFTGVPSTTIKGTDRTDIDYLPGVALKYELTPRMLLRAAYGLTVARPQIRELAPYGFYDFLRDRTIVGDPDLKRSRIHNADLRWEWFFDEGQVLAVSAFYKHFRDPIELAVLDPVSGNSQYRNGNKARNLGAEFELRTNLGRLARALRWFNVDGNVALVHSRIELPKDLVAVRSTRRLAGQSPYVANLSLRFHEAVRGVTAALIYNVVGPRISEVATLRGDIFPPDIEERAFHSLDFVASQELGRHFRLKLKVRNLLMQDRELYAGNFLAERLEQGISGSLSLTASY
jgi:hypothetical protein